MHARGCTTKPKERQKKKSRIQSRNTGGGVCYTPGAGRQGYEAACTATAITAILGEMRSRIGVPDTTGVSSSTSAGDDPHISMFARSAPRVLVARSWRASNEGRVGEEKGLQPPPPLVSIGRDGQTAIVHLAVLGCW
jgi:hypothetical protein